ncbi:MAG: hypothetical protein IKA68_00535 [Clostridia bacterium]|nr:hypothetical protein [Clostridia bacterium]
MKKIIKIAALILALLCIGTSFASCGQSKEDLANEIKNNIIVKFEQIDYVNAKQCTQTTYTASDIFPGFYEGTTIKKPTKISNKIVFNLNEESRTLTIDFQNAIHGLTVNDGKSVITITLPIEIKNTSYGTISEDKKSVTAEYIYDPSKYPGIHLIEPDIIINY